MTVRLIWLAAPAVLAACAGPAPRVAPEDRESRAPDPPTTCATPADPRPAAAPPAEVQSEPRVLAAPAIPVAVEPPDPLPSPPASAWDFYRERYDADGDGRITREEYTRSDAGFANLDPNKDGVVSAEDFVRRWNDTPRRKGFVFGEGGPQFGDPAPDLRLPTTAGDEIDLARFRGKKPVVLVFGSFTCGPYCMSAEPLRALAERYGATVQFLAVYVREAHPLDGVLPERHTGRWLAGSPERHLFVEDPITTAERVVLARQCAATMELGFPMLVDGLDDAASTAYAAWPERLYVVDLDGTIAYRGGKGPDEFFPEELAKVLERCSDSWARGSPAGSAARLPAKDRVKNASDRR